MNINKPPKWLRFLYRNLNWSVDTCKKELYLTFDDGPTPIITDWVLAELAKYSAKATFFCIGRNVERHPSVYQKIIYDGHSVGNHTYSHLKGWNVSNDEYFNDTELASQFINSRLFRPPYGKIKHSQIKRLKSNGYNLFMWDVLSEDYNQNISEEQCLINVTDNTQNGSIIVFHDSIKASANLKYALPIVLKTFSDKGFVFKSL